MSVASAGSATQITHTLDLLTTTQQDVEQKYKTNRLRLDRALMQVFQENSNDRVHRLHQLNKIYLDLLYGRDKLHELIEQHPIKDSEILARIAEQDHSLRKLTFDILGVYRLDFEEWRETRNPDSKRWWWYLDEARFGSQHWKHNIFRPFVYTILALFIIWFSIAPLVDVANRLSSFFVSIFARSNLANLGLDLFTVGTFIIQILIGGRVTQLFAKRLTRGLNVVFRRYDGRSRWFVSSFVPFTQMIIGTLFFYVMLTLFSSFVVGSVGDSLRGNLNRAGQSISERQNLFDLANTLNPDSQRPVELTRIGLSYEDIGDFQNARRAYEQALSADPTLIVTAYLLTNLYSNSMFEVSDGDRQVALQIIDLALGMIPDAELVPRLATESTPTPLFGEEQPVESGMPTEAEADLQAEITSCVIAVSDNSESNDYYIPGPPLYQVLHLRCPEYVPQFAYLLQITRAKLLFQATETHAAFSVLNNAEALVNRNRRLFFLGDGHDNSLSTDPPPLYVTELYYTLAQVTTQMNQHNPTTNLRNLACGYWARIPRLINSNVSRELIWNSEANTAINELGCRTNFGAP